jgi:lipopolysaccharide export system permease protein
VLFRSFLTPALIITFVFSLLNIIVINPIGAAMNGRYKAMESHYLDLGPTLELTGAGLWLRQYDGRRHYLLHADHIELNPLTLSPLMAFIYDQNGLYLGRVDAPRAVLGSGRWLVDDAWVNMEQKTAEHVDQWTLTTSLTLDRIQESMASPNTISFWEMPAFIRALKSIGLPSERHQLAFQSLLAQPLLLCSMVFFAACFALRMNRRGGVTAMVLSGVLIGSFAYTLNNVVGALGVNQTLPVPLAAWAVPVIALALSNAALLHLEDG